MSLVIALWTPRQRKSYLPPNPVRRKGCLYGSHHKGGADSPLKKEASIERRLTADFLANLGVFRSSLSSRCRNTPLRLRAADSAEKSLP
jgi:hypothetical protein